MPNDDPFTLVSPGNTSLSAGLGLGVTAFGTTIEPPEEHENYASAERSGAVVSVLGS